MNKSNSEKFLDIVNETFGESEVTKQITSDIENYDRKYFDEIDTPCVAVVFRYGYTNIVKPIRFIHDPYLAKIWNPGEPGCTLFIYQANVWRLASLEEVQAFLHESVMIKRSMTNLTIPQFNNIHGYIVTWDRLLGSVPEAWRPQIEEHLKPQLKNLYDYEAGILLDYCRMHSRQLEVKNECTGEVSWVDRDITKIGVSFEGFSPIREGDTQTTAFFQVSDLSEDFKPELKCNWYLQDTSRWLYSGVIALTICDGKVSISSHH